MSAKYGTFDKAVREWMPKPEPVVAYPLEVDWSDMPKDEVRINWEKYRSEQREKKNKRKV